MKRMILLFTLCLCFVLGCGSYEPSDLEQAGLALRTALVFWKGGKSQADLENESPSILMNETDWKFGKRLLEFKMSDKGTLYGRQVRWQAEIKLQDKNGNFHEEKATYVIDTTPRIVIVRDNFANF
jgi:hypothetical protein